MASLGTQGSVKNVYWRPHDGGLTGKVGDSFDFSTHVFKEAKLCASSVMCLLLSFPYETFSSLNI